MQVQKQATAGNSNISAQGYNDPSLIVVIKLLNSCCGASISCLIGQVQVALVLVSAITDSAMGGPTGDFRGRQEGDNNGSSAALIEQ